MPHTPQGLQSAPLDVFGGLVTNANPESLPHGASPLCWDCDFITGSVFTRPGLTPGYTFNDIFGWGINWGGLWGDGNA
jgi:hypothetical protein